MDTKDKRIHHLIEHLQRTWGPASFLVQDYWEADQCAIGLTDQTRQFLVYVSTLHMHHSKIYVALEILSEATNHIYTPMGDYTVTSLGQLEEIVRRHLKIAR